MRILHLVGLGMGGKPGREVSRITGGAPFVFPPKLATLGTDEGKFWPFTERREIDESACSGESVVVVGGRVSVG